MPQFSDSRDTTPNTTLFLEFPVMRANTRTAQAWVETPGKKSSVRQRRDILRNWLVANRLLPDVPDTHAMSEEERPTRGRQSIELSRRGYRSQLSRDSELILRWTSPPRIVVRDVVTSVIVGGSKTRTDLNVYPIFPKRAG